MYCHRGVEMDIEIWIASCAMSLRYDVLHYFVKSSDGNNDMEQTSTVKSIYRPCKLNNFNFSIRGFKYYERFCSVAGSLSFVSWYSSSFNITFDLIKISFGFLLLSSKNIFESFRHCYKYNLFVQLKPEKGWKCFSKQCTWISETTLLFGMFPGFDNFSFWYGALSKWWWLRDKPDMCYFVRYKSHRGWPGIEPGLPRWQDLSKFYTKVGS